MGTNIYTHAGVISDIVFNLFLFDLLISCHNFSVDWESYLKGVYFVSFLMF